MTQDLPADDDGHPVADHFDVLEDVRTEKNGLALRLEPDDDIADLFPADRIQAAQRLVEEDERGLVDEGLGQPDPLEHPARELAELKVAGRLHADEIEEGGDPLLTLIFFHLEELGIEIEEFPGREIVVEIGIFRQEAQALLGLRLKVRLAKDLDLAPVREDEAEDAFQRGRLAGAVGAQIAEDLALGDGKGNALEDFFFLGDKADFEELVDVFDRQHRFHRVYYMNFKEWGQTSTFNRFFRGRVFPSAFFVE